MASFCFWGVARQRLSTPNLLIICVRTCAHTYTPPHSPHTYIHAHIYTQAIHPFHLSCYVAQLPWPRTHYFSCFSWVLGFIVCTVMPSLQIFLLNFCNYTMKVDATLICIIGKTWMMKKIQIVFFFIQNTWGKYLKFQFVKFWNICVHFINQVGYAEFEFS